ncbi:phosphatase PAP2 family protein [Cellulomonas fulva]|uniref:phosphatase PAP2 family protein n=1 Tax=Cellulomonas fulva TaxID=2835530 RepID=UPI0027DADE3D|nr:phosphatase PAP2 family protein [Cellulomonas fulva]
MIHEYVHRYEIDPTPPRFAAAARDVAVRGLGLAALWWLVLLGVGLVIHGPLDDLQAESSVNEWFVDQRTATLDTASNIASHGGETFVIIGVALLAMALVWWRTRQWWFAIVPGLAVGLQSAVFLSTTLVVGRERPEVEMLDDAPPTSSYPSGHTGAATALYVTFALLAQRIRTPWLRAVVTVLCLAVPLAIGTARLYRGMHHLTDVLMGIANGLVTALLAWRYLRRSVASDASDERGSAEAASGGASSTGASSSGGTSTGRASAGPASSRSDERAPGRVTAAGSAPPGPSSSGSPSTGASATTSSTGSSAPPGSAGTWSFLRAAVST